MSHLLAALQQGSRGTQACINAASAVQGIVGDLDTTVMFAATGTLHPETEGDTFGDHRLVKHTNKQLLAHDTRSYEIFALFTLFTISVGSLTFHVMIALKNFERRYAWRD